MRIRLYTLQNYTRTQIDVFELPKPLVLSLVFIENKCNGSFLIINYALIHPCWNKKCFNIFYCLVVNNIIIFVPHTACRYEKSSWSECSADGEMSRVDKLKANSDPACDQSRRITKKCNKNKQVKATKDKGTNDRYFFNFSKLLENTYPL